MKSVPFDPSDFAESDGQFVLARIGREFFVPAGAALSVRGTVYRTLNRCHSP